MKPKLLLVLTTIFRVRGGIPRFNQMLCMALDRLAPRLGLDVAVISHDDSQADYERHGSPWSHVRFIPGGGRRGLILRTLRHCMRERPDVMLLGILGMTPLGLLCSPFLRRGYGFIGHGEEVWGETRMTRRVAGRRASFALAVSQDTRRSLLRVIDLHEDDVHVLHNTLDPGFEVAEATPTTVKPELLSVARLDALEGRKGIDNTLQAFAAIQKRHPQATYRIVGAGGDKPRMIQLARELELGHRVIFEENLSDEELAERYQTCMAFVLPSGQEGFGIVFLEAMSRSKPCVGARAGGIPEVVVDGTTGLLVDYGDVGELAQVLDRLLSDPELCRTLGLAGRRRLLEVFIFERFEERVEQLIRGIAGI